MASAAAVLALPFLAGCTESYSEELRYPVRSDPIFKTAPTTELPFPDRPGQLPVMSFVSLQDPFNPLHPLLAQETTKPLNPADLDQDDRTVLQDQLEKMFGTPAHPKIDGTDTNIAAQLRKELQLETPTLEDGSRLFRRHCLHCHGLPGDGRGPTSFWINPHPRDYRSGIYKFVSTNVPQGGEQRPRREDLVRTVRFGLDGTAMPSFAALPEEDIDKIVSYVILLGLRGEIELDSMMKMILEKSDRDWQPAVYIQEGLGEFGKRWLNSQKGVMEPDPYPYTTEEEFKQSVLRGREAFVLEDSVIGPSGFKGAGCMKCHPDFGRRSFFRYDAWGTMVRPPDLTQGIYRGGRRPIDLYWRVNAGIGGSGMASFNNILRPNEEQKAKKIDRLWDVINFIMILPYPKMREKYGIELN